MRYRSNLKVVVVFFFFLNFILSLMFLEQNLFGAEI